MPHTTKNHKGSRDNAESTSKITNEKREKSKTNAVWKKPVGGGGGNGSDLKNRL